MRLRFALALLFGAILGAQSPSLVSPTGSVLGSVNSSGFDSHSMGSPLTYGSTSFSVKSLNNSYGQAGSQFLSTGVNRPYDPAALVPKGLAPNADFLGDFSANPTSPNSVSNPYGPYGSRYQPKAIRNPFGTFGNPFSPNGSRNRFGSGAGAPAARIPGIAFPRSGAHR
ncbi:MAG: hypothetical protein GC160_03690 [Acidobacteria bacterium]|nr:hypothetical protein [Acidobacteriota bacterium]